MLNNGKELYWIEKGDSGAFFKKNLILKTTHEFTLDFKSTLKSTLISKTVLAHSGDNFDFKAT